MDPYPPPSNGHQIEDQPNQVENIAAYPPKFVKKEAPSNIWMRSIISLALYLILGYYIFPGYKILLLITAVVIFHEMGHFLAMKWFRYNDLGIFFIPLLGAYVSGTKREVSQKQSAIILLAGPLPGVILGIILYLIDRNGTNHYFLDITYTRISLLLIILNLINLFPIYPLDGGQLLNRVYLEEESVWSKIFLFLSAGLLVWLAIKLHFYVLLVFPAMMLLRLRTDSQFSHIEKKIEASGISIDSSYEDLSDENYWKIRKILIEEHAAFKDLLPGPPYEYDRKEERIMSMIQMLLQRHLIQDVSLVGKIFIFLIWIAAFAAPWLLKMDLSFFSRFGF